MIKPSAFYLYQLVKIKMDLGSAAFFALLIVSFKSGAEGKCTTRGRFPNNDMEDCRGYTMCLSGAGDVYIEYDLSCPQDFIYSHIDSQCTIINTYTCLPTHNCTKVETLIDPTSKCTRYIACVSDLDNKITARLITCPENTIFSTEQNVCVDANKFTCQDRVTVDETELSLNSTNDINVEASTGGSASLHYNFVIYLLLTLFYTIN